MDQPKNFVDVINTKLNCQPRHFDEKNRLKLNHRFHAAIITEKSRFYSQTLFYPFFHFENSVKTETFEIICLYLLSFCSLIRSF